MSARSRGANIGRRSNIPAANRSGSSDASWSSTTRGDPADRPAGPLGAASDGRRHRDTEMPRQRGQGGRHAEGAGVGRSRSPGLGAGRNRRSPALSGDRNVLQLKFVARHLWDLPRGRRCARGARVRPPRRRPSGDGCRAGRLHRWKDLIGPSLPLPSGQRGRQRGERQSARAAERVGAP